MYISEANNDQAIYFTEKIQTMVSPRMNLSEKDMELLVLDKSKGDLTKSLVNRTGFDKVGYKMNVRLTESSTN